MSLEHTRTVLEQAGVRFEPGLTNEEIQSIENRYGFRFPPDYREFLMFALPTSGGFVDWRHAEPALIQQWLAWPYEGMCFDIENNVFWLNAWGPRPEALADACAIARQAVEQAPTLIPILGHRYIPATPAEAGNPVFSVHQTDIIYYGRDLFEYLENEFGHRYQITEPVKTIPFWSYLVNDIYLNEWSLTGKESEDQA